MVGAVEGSPLLRLGRVRSPCSKWTMEKRILSWRDFGATLGRSVPPHRGEGEIWARCLNGEAILDIYVSEE